MKWVDGILSSPFLPIMAGGLIISMIITASTVAIVILGAFTVCYVTYAGYRFISKQIIVLKRILAQNLKLFVHQYIENFQTIKYHGSKK